ncbi:hypothetical protein K435DRAFT_874922 [Dendrothele bispora CBS 962.96]|uniref:Xylanolytic transcriptional activator regulatory domain-containing protein n=1 Tax=Dendrothele bispora (strain CBS 962.96) TaxID=1314807 RepID=A0A4S8KVI3_DENBC|nr:hypothetical protein K435DRAFT_874922 [Dendrothele bispora CBS 962.96]
MGFFWISYQNGRFLTDLWAHFSNALIPTSQILTGKRSSSGIWTLTSSSSTHDSEPDWVCERNAAWMLLGQTSRTALALGMHRGDGENGNFGPVERNMKSCWWVLHVFGRNLSELLGRPPNTNLTDVSATLPEDTFVDKEEDVPEKYLQYAVGSTRISSRVKKFVACISMDLRVRIDCCGNVRFGNGLLEELEEWRYKLPEHFFLRAEDGRDDIEYSATRRKHHRRATGLLTSTQQEQEQQR